MIQQVKKDVGAVEHAEREHAICSASGAERWLNCPGSIFLSTGLPEEPPSKWAAEGTRAHELAERVLREWQKNGRKILPGTYDGLRREYEDTRDPESGWTMVDYVETYINLCLDEIQNFDGGKCDVMIEKRLTLDAEMKMFGTTDFFITGLMDNIPTGVIVDLKYGKGKKVKLLDNPQLAYYAVALKKCSSKSLERIKVRVVQPRLDEFYGEQWYDSAALAAWEQKLILGAEEALWQASGLKTPVYKEGSWCWFCQAKKICPEIAAKRAERAAKAFTILEDPSAVEG